MRVFVDVEEAGTRLEALIELARQGDEIVLCRGGRSVAVITPSSGVDERPAVAANEVGIDGVWDFAKEGRGAASGATSERGGLYDEARAPH